MDKIEKIPIHEDVKRVFDNVSHILIGLNYKETARDYKQAVEKLISLSEEPDKSLDEAAERIAKNILGRDYLAELDEDCAIDALEDAKNFVKAGAEWQKNQMLKDAVKGKVNQDGFLELSNGEVIDICPTLKRCALGLHIGDKVRIVVLKAEEE